MSKFLKDIANKFSMENYFYQFQTICQLMLLTYTFKLTKILFIIFDSSWIKISHLFCRYVSSNGNRLAWFQCRYLSIDRDSKLDLLVEEFDEHSAEPLKLTHGPDLADILMYNQYLRMEAVNILTFENWFSWHLLLQQFTQSMI